MTVLEQSLTVFIVHVCSHSMNGKMSINTLTPERWCCNLKLVISKLITSIDSLSFSSEIAMWMPQDLTDD